MLNLPLNLAFLISIISLGNSKLKLDLQSFIMSMSDVLKSFIRNLVTAKSIDLTSDFSNAKHSSPYSNIGSLQFHFRNAINSGILRSGSRECRFCLRQPFLSQEAVCILRFRWPLCATISRALRAEYCIVGILHNAAI